MRDWLCKILCKSTDTVSVVERAYEDELQERVIGLKRRIAAIKSSNGWIEESIKTAQAQPKSVVAETTKSTIHTRRTGKEVSQKDREMNDLKAKLLGYKK